MMMNSLALLVTLKAKEGKEDEARKLLEHAASLASEDDSTVTWYALQFDANTFGIFDTFADEESRDNNMSGDALNKIKERADELFEDEPNIQKAAILATK